jgi:hypothetical protein
MMMILPIACKLLSGDVGECPTMRRSWFTRHGVYSKPRRGGDPNPVQSFSWKDALSLPLPIPWEGGIGVLSRWRTSNILGGATLSKAQFGLGDSAIFWI